LKTTLTYAPKCFVTLFQFIVGLHVLLNFSVSFGNITLNTDIFDKNFGKKCFNIIRLQ